MSLLTNLISSATVDSSLPLAGLLMLNQQHDHPQPGKAWTPPDIQPKRPDLPMFDPDSVPDTAKPVVLNITDVDNAFKRFHQKNTDSKANNIVVLELVILSICLSLH